MKLVELDSLKKEFIHHFLKEGVEEDVIKKIRKILKEFKEQIYGRDSLQKVLSQNIQNLGCSNAGGSLTPTTNTVSTNSSL